jgi:hypothetical protein
MAIATQTSAVKQELLRQLNITAKDLYVILTQPRDIAQTGPAFDAKIATLKTALTAAGY